TGGVSRGPWFFCFARELRSLALAAAWDCRTGPADCLRQSGESDAGARHGTGARDRRAACFGGIARTPHEPVAGRKPPARRGGRSPRRLFGTNVEPVPGCVSQYRGGPAVRRSGGGLARVRLH